MAPRQWCELPEARGRVPPQNSRVIYPLTNTVTVQSNPTGFTNNISGSASWTVDILDPKLTILKTPDDGVVKLGDIATFSILVSNTGGGRALGVKVSDLLPDPNSNLTWTFATSGNPNDSFNIGDVPTAISMLAVALKS